MCAPNPSGNIPGNIQGTFGEYSGHIQGTSRAHSGNIEGTLRANSGHSQGSRDRMLAHSPPDTFRTLEVGNTSLLQKIFNIEIATAC
jgi:hypothetical protein